MDPFTLAILIGIGVVSATGLATSAMGAALSCCTIKRIKVMEEHSSVQSESETKGQKIINKKIKVKHKNGDVETILEQHFILSERDESKRSDFISQSLNFLANGQKNEVAETLAEKGGDISKAAAKGLDILEMASIVPEGMEAFGIIAEEVIEGGGKIAEHHKDKKRKDKKHKKSEEPEQIELPASDSDDSHPSTHRDVELKIMGSSHNEDSDTPFTETEA